MRTLFAFAVCSLAIVLPLSNGYPQPQTKSENHPTAQDKRGTQESPLVIQGNITTKAPEKTERDRQQEEEKIEIERSLAKYAGWTAVITGVLVLVTGALAFVTYKLWTATNKLVISADNTATHELRAYMGVATNRILKGQGETAPHCVELVIQNFGKTMAKDTKIWINATITAEAITDFPLGERKSKTVVMPNESLGFQHDIDLPNNTRGHIYLWGRIEYEDVFQESHWTTFRFMEDKPAWLTSMTGQAPGWTTKTCDEGNNAT